MMRSPALWARPIYNGYGYGSRYGSGKTILAGGRIYKLVGPEMTTRHGFKWPASGVVSLPGPFSDLPDEPCPQYEDDGLCVGLTRSALESGGMNCAPPNRLLLVEVDPDDVLGASDTKLRARKVTVVREATVEEWEEVE